MPHHVASAHNYNCGGRAGPLLHFGIYLGGILSGSCRPEERFEAGGQYAELHGGRGSIAVPLAFRQAVLPGRGDWFPVQY
jgi:hypothetical protein